MRFRIETRSEKRPEWTTETDSFGEVVFESLELAEGTVTALQSLGDDWAAAEYRIVEVD